MYNSLPSKGLSVHSEAKNKTKPFLLRFQVRRELYVRPSFGPQTRVSVVQTWGIKAAGCFEVSGQRLAIVTQWVLERTICACVISDCGVLWADILWLGSIWSVSGVE